jgi:hypothetical protein
MAYIGQMNNSLLLKENCTNTQATIITAQRKRKSSILKPSRIILSILMFSTMLSDNYLSIYLWLYSPLLDLGCFFSFLIFYTVSRTPWMGDQPVARPMPAHRTAQTQNKHTQTSMPQVGFEPTIPVFEQVKTVHALDGTVTVIGISSDIVHTYQIASNELHTPPMPEQ